MLRGFLRSSRMKTPTTMKSRARDEKAYFDLLSPLVFEMVWPLAPYYGFLHTLFLRFKLCFSDPFTVFRRFLILFLYFLFFLVSASTLNFLIFCWSIFQSLILSSTASKPHIEVLISITAFFWCCHWHLILSFIYFLKSRFWFSDEILNLT